MENPKMTGPTSTMALTQVGEPPDVPQSHTEPHTGEHVLSFIVPLRTVSSLDLLHVLQLSMGGDSVLQTRVRQLQLHSCSLENRSLCIPCVCES